MSTKTKTNKEKMTTELVIYSGTNKLIKRVHSMINANENIHDYLHDIVTYGCESGCEPQLIYNVDTLAFYKKYKQEIKARLVEILPEYDYSFANMFGDKWDMSDPFVDELQNQTLLVWWAYEDICYQFFRELEH